MENIPDMNDPVSRHSLWASLSNGGADGRSTSIRREELCELVQIYRDCLSIAGIDLQNWTVEKEKKSYKMAIQRFGLSDRSDITDDVTENDLIEVYRADGIQLYRSYNFFRFSSYSIVDLLCNSWDALYDRATSVTNQIRAETDHVQTNQLENHTYRVPVHWVREKLLANAFHFLLRMNKCSVLYDNEHDCVSGFVHTISIEEVSKTLPSRVQFI